MRCGVRGRDHGGGTAQLNLFWGVLLWKRAAEEYLRRSGLRWTIVRPGGLKDEGEAAPIVTGPAGTFGLPPARTPGSILRRQVADVCVEALAEPGAFNAVVECVAVAGGPPTAPRDWFGGTLAPLVNEGAALQTLL